MICSSVNLDRLIRPSLHWAGLYLFLDEFQGVTSRSTSGFANSTLLNPRARGRVDLGMDSRLEAGEICQSLSQTAVWCELGPGRVHRLLRPAPAWPSPL